MPTKYSISAASRITGKSRTTISKHLKQGKLSCEEGGDGAKLIDASELIRVYGDACAFDVDQSRDRQPSPAEKPPMATEQGVQAALTTLQTQLDKEVTERERERAHYREQIEQLQAALERAQEGHNRATLLLENKAGGGELQAAMQLLRSEMHNLKEEARKLAREEVRSQPWWKWVGPARRKS